MLRRTTGNLRWVRRKGRLILQQEFAFYNPVGTHHHDTIKLEWRDVPVVDEEPEPKGDDSAEG